MSHIEYRGQTVDEVALALCLKKRPVKCIRIVDREREAREADLASYERQLPETMTEKERYDFRRGWECLLGRLVGPRYTWGDIQDAFLAGGQDAVERMVDDATGIDWIRRMGDR